MATVTPDAETRVVASPCIHVARRDVLVDGVPAWRCVDCGEIDYNRWEVRIDSSGHATEVHIDTAERREHVHTWRPSTCATGQGIEPCLRCRCGTGRHLEDRRP